MAERRTRLGAIRSSSATDPECRVAASPVSARGIKAAAVLHLDHPGPNMGPMLLLRVRLSSVHVVHLVRVSVSDDQYARLDRVIPVGTIGQRRVDDFNPLPAEPFRGSSNGPRSADLNAIN